jgi:hypothetical protein
MATRIVDSDAHVIEGQELMAELVARFPDKIRMARPDEEDAALVIGENAAAFYRLPA